MERLIAFHGRVAVYLRDVLKIFNLIEKCRAFSIIHKELLSLNGNKLLKEPVHL